MANPFGWMKHLNPLRPVGEALRGASEAQAQQRAARLEMEMDREGLRQSGERSYIDALFGREQERRAGAGDAWRRLMQVDRVRQGGTQMPMLSPYSRPGQGPGAVAQNATTSEAFINELTARAQGADPINPFNSGHTDMLLRRLAMPGSESTPNVYGQMDRHTRPGKGEQVSGWLAGLLGGGRDAK